MKETKDVDRYFTTKYKKCLNDLMYINPILLNIFADLVLWAHTRNLPIKITRILDDKIPGVSISRTHEEGRAIDISIKGWSIEDVEKCREYFNRKYVNDAAIGEKSGRPVLIPDVEHGTGPHIHIQSRYF